MRQTASFAATTTRTSSWCATRAARACTRWACLSVSLLVTQGDTQIAGGAEEGKQQDDDDDDDDLDLS